MRCFFHDWSKWDQTSMGEVVDNIGRTKGYYIRQVRKCSKCGRVDVRIQRAEK